MPAQTKHRGQRKAGQSSAPPAADQVQQSFDGPDDSPGRGRAGSTVGPRASSRGPSQTRATSQTRRVDPARDRTAAPLLLKNVDFGGQAYDMFSSVSGRCSHLQIHCSVPTSHCSPLRFTVEAEDFGRCQAACDRPCASCFLRSLQPRNLSVTRCARYLPSLLSLLSREYLCASFHVPSGHSKTASRLLPWSLYPEFVTASRLSVSSQSLHLYHFLLYSRTQLSSPASNSI